MKNIDPKKDMQRIGLSKRSQIPMLTLKTHSILDYLLAFIIAISPYVFGFANITAGRNLFLITEAILILYSLITDYSYSLVSILPFSLHRAFDWTAGAFIAIGYSLFGYGGRLTAGQTALHLILGFMVILSGTLTRTLTLSEAVDTSSEKKDHAA
jgi:hypothetical protein